MTPTTPPWTAARRAALPIALALALGACGAADGSGDNAAVPPPAPVASPAPPPSAPATDGLPVDESPDTAAEGVPEAARTTPAPDTAALLAAAFPGAALAPGSSDGGFTLPDGREVRPWFGQVLAHDGGAIHVGFVSVGDPAAEAPGDTVEIAEATSRFVDSGWQPLSASAGIGRFGGRGRAPTADGGQDARVHHADGRLLLAVPTADAANAGIVVYGYELFAAEGDPLAWRHVGRVPAGSDNRAGCSDAPGGPLPCASTAGTLEFVTDTGGPWPALRLPLQGTVIDGPGTVRATTAADVVELAFDAASGTYRPARPIPDAAY